jgi:hypothetical protein
MVTADRQGLGVGNGHLKFAGQFVHPHGAALRESGCRQHGGRAA